ncbi:MAG: hypothetical protein ACP5TE_11900 [Verrucomicrobiia bacterium]
MECGGKAMECGGKAMNIAATPLCDNKCQIIKGINTKTKTGI